MLPVLFLVLSCVCAQAGAPVAANRADVTVYGKDSVSICENALPLRYGDTTFYAGTASGVYNIRFVKGVGYDSIVRLSLTILPSYTKPDTLKICQDALPYSFHSQVIPASTPVGTSSRIVTLKTVHGCDSVIFLHLVIYPSYAKAEELKVCANQLPITYAGKAISSAGKYTIPLQSVNGCDSVITLTVVAPPAYEKKDTVRLCAENLPYQHAGQWFTQGGDYVVPAKTKEGCDSVLYLSLVVYQYPEVKDTLRLCRTALPYRYGSVMLTDKGDYDVKLKSVQGCDSLIKVTVIIAPTYRVPRNMHLCVNDLPYRYGDLNITDSGSYTVPMQSVYHCDSIVELHVTLGHPSSHAFSDTICFGEGYYRNGYAMPPGAFTNDYLIIYGRRPAANSEGCDSSFALTIRVMPAYENNDSLLICEGSLPIRRHGRVFNAPGDYSINLYTVYGCDSIINFCLQTTRSYSRSLTAHFCAGSVYTLGDSSFRETGNYVVSMQTKDGCDSVVYLSLIKDDRLPYTPGQIYTKQDLYETDKHTFWISSVPNAYFYKWTYTNPLWQPIGATNDYVFAMRNIQPEDTGTVTVVAGNACGLSSASRVTVEPTAVQEAMEGRQIRLYPNPVPEQFVLETGDAVADGVEVCDVTGRCLLRQPLYGDRTEISMQRFSAGCYLVRVMDGRRVVKALPVVKQ
ncbi:MAG: T9SS type A sorting domain-containing protein [Bacteroidales bacterium]|nr:T9SS type A sorting domain-containing protein [Bacteroidales bacterium]